VTTLQSQIPEARILGMVKKVLTDVAKDTHTPPGMRHPLSDNTINGIRACLDLIVARETELDEEKGEVSTGKPRFIDEPSDKVVVQLDMRKPGNK
jgi:hypothetical protein